MEVRRLGRTGLSIGVIGLGGAGIGQIYKAVDDDTATAIVHRAIALGVNYLDTAPVYRDSETRLGQALRGRRDEVILATKCGMVPAKPSRITDYDGILRSVEASLAKLQTDHVEVLQYHELQAGIVDEVLAADGALGAMQRLRDEGVCRWLGVTSREHQVLADALATDAFDVALTWMGYSAVSMDAVDTVFGVAAEHDVGLIVGSPLVAGLLSGIDPATWNYGRGWPAVWYDKARQAGELAASWGRSLPETVLPFELADPRVTALIPGAGTIEELEANVAAAGMTLTEAQRAAIEELARS